MTGAALLAALGVVATLVAARRAIAGAGGRAPAWTCTWLERAVDRAGIEVPPQRAAGVVLLTCGAGTVSGTVLWGPVGGLLLGALPVAAVAGSTLLGSRRQAGRSAAELPVALEAIARGLRSGASLTQATEEAALAVREPLRGDLRGVCASTRAGVRVTDALARWGDDRPLPGIDMAIAAIELGARSGGAQARAIDGVAATLRDQLSLRREIDALASQARSSALVIAALPAAFLLLASAADIEITSFLLGSRLGLVCLGGGILLEAAGGLWMHRLTRALP